MMDDDNHSGTSAPLVILSMLISEDGFIAGPKGELDWVLWGPEMDVAALDLLNRADIFVAGHNAFKDMAGYWPTVARGSEASADEQAYAKKLCTMPKAVIGRPCTPPVWDERATIAPNSLRAGHADLAHEFGSVIAFGGTRTAQTLIAEDLVDELHLFVSPVLIGAGHRLFVSDANMQLRFETVGTQEFAIGGSLQTLAPRPVKAATPA